MILLGFVAIAAPPVLLADWIGAVIWLVVISIGVINQMLGADKKKQAAKRPPAPQAGGGQQPQGPKGLMDEVEKFLQEARKATEQAQRRPPQQQQRPPQPQTRPQQPPKPVQRTAKERAGAQRKQQQKEAASKRLAQEEAARGGLAARQLRSSLELSSEEETFRGSVAEHVEQHLDTRGFEERAGRLSHLQKTVEQDIGGHVHNVFDHQVGTLGDRPTVTTAAGPAAPANPVEQLVAMLRDPQSLRNAMILQEILRPPADRW